MKEFFAVCAILLSVAALVVLKPFQIPVFDPSQANLTKQESQIVYPTQEALPPPQPLVVNLGPVTQNKAIPVMVLGSRNTITFRGPVTDESVAEAQRELLAMSERLGPNDPIYLVLDTPGGSIDAGNLLIDTIKSLPQKVKTITVFAASMGFHIVENLDERLITPSGTLMSHRARVGGLGGEIPGELIVRINHILRILQVMDVKVANRLGMDFDKYRELIRDEYWVYGQDSVDAKAADKVVLARCGKDMMGTVDQDIPTFFGKLKVTFSKCPMITAPLKIDMSELRFELPRQQAEVKEFVDIMFSDKESFVKKFIVDNSFQKFLP